VKYITETTPAESKQIEYTYPVSDATLCSKFESAIEDLEAQGKNPRLAIFDTIASLPGVRMPFEELTKLCRKHEVLSLLDAAHSVGAIPVDIGKLDPDFFVSNCHKWLFVPRGCAVFYTAERNHKIMRSTLPTSHGFVPQPAEDGSDAIIRNPLPPNEKSEFVRSFEFVGTMDNSPFLCVPAALEWRKKLTWQDKTGENAVYAYLGHLAREAGRIVSSKLNTEVMDNEESTLTNCMFSNVRLPLDFLRDAHGDFDQGVKLAQQLSETLVKNYDTFMAIIFYGDAWWVRLSAQVYLTTKDFEWAGDTLDEICGKLQTKRRDANTN
jgi:selenocysteine lyase/cysteine desulfurase